MKLTEIIGSEEFDYFNLTSWSCYNRRGNKYREIDGNLR